MTLSSEQKQEIVEEFQQHPDDTGSAPVQIALLTHQITDLTEHLREHPSDHHSRQGLLNMVGKRKRLLDYMESEDQETFNDLTERLNIRVKLNR